jgi:hypothetical protein
MKPSQAEMVLRFAENTYSAGDEAIAEMRRLGAEHMQRVLDDSDMIARAREINEADKKRFSRYLPQQQQQRPELTQGQATMPKPAQLPLRKAAE